jgi:hypothetical protein
VLVIKYYWGHQIKKNEVGGACGMYGGEERCIMGLGGNMREKAHLEDVKTILKWILKE